MILTQIDAGGSAVGAEGCVIPGILGIEIVGRGAAGLPQGKDCNAGEDGVFLYKAYLLPYC